MQLLPVATYIWKRLFRVVEECWLIHVAPNTTNLRAREIAITLHQHTEDAPLSPPKSMTGCSGDWDEITNPLPSVKFCYCLSEPLADILSREIGKHSGVGPHLSHKTQTHTQRVHQSVRRTERHAERQGQRDRLRDKDRGCKKKGRLREGSETERQAERERERETN